jgi:hypothetical protein
MSTHLTAAQLPQLTHRLSQLSGTSPLFAISESDPGDSAENSLDEQASEECYREQLGEEEKEEEKEEEGSIGEEEMGSDVLADGERVFLVDGEDVVLVEDGDNDVLMETLSSLDPEESVVRNLQRLAAIGPGPDLEQVPAGQLRESLDLIFNGQVDWNSR